MKKLFYFLVFLITGTYCFSQGIEKLPVKPWDDILEMNSQKYSPITKWDIDIFVGLEGNYSKNRFNYNRTGIKEIRCFNRNHIY